MDLDAFNHYPLARRSLRRNRTLPVATRSLFRLPQVSKCPSPDPRRRRPEFYSASRGAGYRLDASGRVVWRQALQGLVNALDAAPPAGAAGSG
ncbi:MAG: hypothetical protein ACREA0_08825, partial [bacterium]